MYDLIVIGGGPAGVTAALRGRELGATVALIERGRMGGTCTNDGCVPTRVLAKAARLVRDAEQFADYGLSAERPSIDFVRLLERTHRIIDTIHGKKQLDEHLRYAGVTVLQGEACFTGPHTVTLTDGTTAEGATFVIAAGGRARRLPFAGGELALTHSDVWTLQQQPRSLAIIGAAATGCQIASVFSAFGTDVTLLEMAPRLIPGEDEAISEALGNRLRQHGIQTLTGIGGVERLE